MTTNKCTGRKAVVVGVIAWIILSSIIIAYVFITQDGEIVHNSPKTTVTREDIEAAEKLVHSIEAEHLDYELLPGAPGLDGKMLVAVRDGPGRTEIEYRFAFDTESKRYATTIYTFNITRDIAEGTESIPSEHFIEDSEELETLVYFYAESEDTGYRYTNGAKAYRSHYYATVIHPKEKTRYHPQFVITVEPPTGFVTHSKDIIDAYGTLQPDPMVNYVERLLN